jgi:hypothetical protein
MTHILFQADVNIINWLLQQAPVVVVMGAAIYWLADRLKKAENDKDELAKDVIKLTTLWEEKSDKLDVRNEKLGEKNTKVNEEILVLLRQIKMIVTERGL